MQSASEDIQGTPITEDYIKQHLDGWFVAWDHNSGTFTKPQRKRKDFIKWYDRERNYCPANWRDEGNVLGPILHAVCQVFRVPVEKVATIETGRLKHRRLAQPIYVYTFVAAAAELSTCSDETIGKAINRAAGTIHSLRRRMKNMPTIAQEVAAYVKLVKSMVEA